MPLKFEICPSQVTLQTFRQSEAYRFKALVIRQLISVAEIF